MSLRRAFTILISLSLTLPQLSFAQPMQATPESAMELTSEFIFRMKNPEADSTFLVTGRNEYLAMAVVAPLTALEPDDFNRYIFHLLDRYVKTPSERPHIFALIKNLNDVLAADLSATEKLHEGPTSHIIHGGYAYGALLIVLGAFSWRFVLSRNQWVTNKLLRSRQFELKLAERGRLYAFGYNALKWSTPTFVLGGGLGYLEYLKDNYQAHRLNPAKLLMVVQANLACDLSLQGLALQDHFEKIKTDKDQLNKDGPKLITDFQDILEQAKDLKKQWPLLTSLKVNDRLFVQTLGDLPKSKDWQQYRSALADGNSIEPGQCRQMSMEHLERALSKTLGEVEEKIEEPALSPPIKEPK